MDSERLKIPKTDYLLTDLEDEESVSIDFQVCRPQKYKVPYHLNISKIFSSLVLGLLIHYMLKKPGNKVTLLVCMTFGDLVIDRQKEKIVKVWN